MSLQVRVRVATAADREVVRQAVQEELAKLLTEHELQHVTVEHADEVPEQSAGGKYRKIIPLS